MEEKDYSVEEELREGNQPYEKLGFSNYFIFGKVMSKKSLCIKLLSCLTNNEIKNITSVIVENESRITYDSKGTRYDLYVEDSSGRIYDAEMQNFENGIRKQLPYRSRFYQGLIDLLALEKGADYSNLKSSYVIFICTFDPFWQGKACYTFENICREGSELSLNDGRTILFFNTEGDLSMLSEEQRNLMEYIKTGNVKGRFTEELDLAVRNARNNRKWRAEYMKTLVYNNDLKNAGRREGLQTGLSSGLKALVNSLKKFCDDFEMLYNIVISNEDYTNVTREEVLKYY